MTLTVEVADAHAAGECVVDCPHPECAWVGAVDLASILPEAVFDAPEQLEPVYL